jgi:hypothetical protein
MYPRSLNAAARLAVVDVGRSVPTGATKTAPVIIGLPADTLDELLMSFILLNSA